MKKTTLLTFFIFLNSVPQFIYSQNSDATKKKVIFVIIDGISADQLKAAKTPYLDSIGTIGGYSNAYVGGIKDTYAETPTISAVGYNSLLTGTWANKHNVYGNGIKEPNYNYPTIFRLFKDEYPNGTTAIFSSWLDNRTKLVGDGLKATNNLKVDFAFDGYEHDTINYPHDKQRNFMKLIDISVADNTAKTIVNNAPDISWVYLEYTDDMGHGFGDGDRFTAAINFEDEQIGKIWNAIKIRQKQFNEDWLFIITTDHGRNKENGKGHGGQSERERSTWIVTNASNTNSYFKNNTVSIVDILPTVINFLGIDVSPSIKREWDGVPLIGTVDATNLRTKIENKNLIISWNSLSTTEAKLYLSDSNHFKSGKTDNYNLLKSVNTKDRMVKIPLRKLPKGFFKLTLETSNTILNTWITRN
ncbi:alkaline phosphatase family protein [Aureibaculum algae]|uniref:Alkaline phosphatase family protein n=1 Tax=Aureibaculum algae TaxID=2584122 RepID=A0A5B7TTE8_9FLAO|nr:alkaline phosphatase family protein [Aureibaculum algae]QCX38473.1 alkaline phosphatase family protein [Aureibaculum algae]